MKKTILMIMTIASMINNSKAQEVEVVQENRMDFRDRCLFGIKVGVNYSNVYDTQGEAFQSDPKLGLAAGMFLAIPIGRFFGIQPEVLFSQKGFQATGMLLNNTYDFTRTTNYVDVPLLFALKPGGLLTLLAGPQFSYLMKQKDVFANATTSIDQEKEFENANIRKNILGFVVGADITIKHIVLGVRAGWDVQNNNGDGTSTTPRYKNVLYQATIGYRFFNY